MLTLQNALVALQKHSSSNYITPQDVQRLLQNANGTTFARILHVSRQPLAAANKAIEVHKVTQANVQLFNNLQTFTNVYKRAVERSAVRLGATAQQAADYEVSSTYFEHTACYSIVKHKLHDKFYLYAIYNNASTLFICNSAQIARADVAQLCTPSEAKKLLNTSNTTHNVRNNIEHDVVVRTIAMDNIVEMRAMQQTIAI